MPCVASVYATHFASGDTCASEIRCIRIKSSKVIACFAASCARPPKQKHTSIVQTKPFLSLARFMDPSPCRNESLVCGLIEWVYSPSVLGRNPQEKATKIAATEECTKSACSSESPPKIRASVAQLSRTGIPVERARYLAKGPCRSAGVTGQSVTIFLRNRLTHSTGLFPRNFRNTFPIVLPGDRSWLFSSHATPFLGA